MKLTRSLNERKWEWIEGVVMSLGSVHGFGLDYIDGDGDNDREFQTGLRAVVCLFVFCKVSA
jgi:hypothetical protein